MARVQGIIGAGLQSATIGRDQAAQERAERDAAAVKERVESRVKRAAATQQDSEVTDNLGSIIGGLGAASVFGGPAGLLVFGLSKLLTGKRREGIAAYRQQAAESSEALIGRSESALEQFEAQATTDQERAEIAMMRNEWESLKPMMGHPNPQVAAEALLRGQELTGTFDEVLDDFQAERIAAQDVERQQFSDEIGRADGIRDDVYREGGSFLIRQDAYERALAVEDTAAGDQVLLVNSFKMVDPNSAVLPGEAATAANTAGVPDFLVTAYNRSVRDGERLDPDQRADIIRQMGVQYQVARADQVDRNTAAIERGRDQGIRSDLLPHMTIPVKTMDELPFPTGALHDETSRRALSGPAPRQDVAPGVGEARIPTESGDTFGTGAGRAADVIGTEFGDMFSDVLVGFKGGKKFIGSDGNPYVEFPDGTVERGRVDTNSFASPVELIEANQDAKRRADELAHNARIRRERQRLGANPETGTFPIERRPTNE